MFGFGCFDNKNLLNYCGSIIYNKSVSPIKNGSVLSTCRRFL